VQDDIPKQSACPVLSLHHRQLGNNPYTSISPNVVPFPVESSLPRVPIYTFPFATVGTVNFTAFPAVSRPPAASELFQSSIEMLLASNACKIEGPAALLAPFFVPNAALSIAHTMPFAVADDDEIDGVAPANPKPDGVKLDGVVVSAPRAGHLASPFTFSAALRSILDAAHAAVYRARAWPKNNSGRHKKHAGPIECARCYGRCQFGSNPYTSTSPNVVPWPWVSSFPRVPT
jgi:hypothetical protein